MNVVFFGTPEFVLPVLEKIKQNFDLVGVVTTPDTIQGRKKVLTPTPVKQFALDKNINVPIMTPEQLDDQTIEQLKSLNPDLFVVAAYGKIIPQNILDIPKYGSINVHPSLLPKYRGPSPIQTAVLNGDDQTGVTLILMDREVDHGPILAQEKFPLSTNDNFASLHIRLFEKAGEMLIPTINDFIDNKLTPKEQNHTEATFCERITKESGYFEVKNPPSPQILDRMIRAFYPWPTAWTKIDGKIMKFLPEGKIQPEGKKPMTKKDFLNGYPQFKQLLEKLLQE